MVELSPVKMKALPGPDAENICCVSLQDSGVIRHVAVNHENDTCFENGLVMGYVDCKYFAGLVSYWERFLQI